VLSAEVMNLLKKIKSHKTSTEYFSK